MDIDNFTVVYRDGEHSLLALDNVSMRLEGGLVTALVGESGSGKTTLAKALMGLLPKNARTRGRIRLGEREFTGWEEANYGDTRWVRVAMVFQNRLENLNPLYRIVDQVAEPLIHRRGMKAAAAAILAEKALLEMGLSRAIVRRYPHEVSGGQLQRALIAMALILDPEVLILDEPTSALDAAYRGFISAMIRNLRDRGKAILLISHDLDLVAKTADQVAVLYLGQVMEVLPAGELLQQPLHPYSLALGRSFPGMEVLRDLGGIRGDGFYRLTHSHQLPGAAAPHVHVVSVDDVKENIHAPDTGCIFRPRCTQSRDECRQAPVPLLTAGNRQIRCLRGGIATLLSLEEVGKTYGAVTALAPTNLNVRAGEVLCLVGETGSGKTTLAMIAAGALAPDQGIRVFAGRDMDGWMKEDYGSLAAKIGVIYQNPVESVSHRFNAFDIVAEPLRIQQGLRIKSGTGAVPRGAGDDLQRQVQSVLRDVHLPTSPEFLQRYPHELNMGAIQRLCLARALVHDPLLIVADEPTSSLDPSVQAKVLRTLMNLQIEKGLTLIFVTHDIGLARKISDRIGVMLAGRLVEIGPAALVIGRPGHPYTRGLIESARGSAQAHLAGGSDWSASAGCPFVERCDRSRNSCGRQTPPPVNLNSGAHLAWCFYPLLPRPPVGKNHVGAPAMGLREIRKMRERMEMTKRENFTEELILRPVGYVRNELKTPLGGPDEAELEGELRREKIRQRERQIKTLVSEVIIEPGLEGILEGIEDYSHLLVIYWPHLLPAGHRELRQVHPLGCRDLPKRGIFATRSPARPNPLLISTVALLERKRNVLRVQGLEALDGSPVLDIKPYVEICRPVENPRFPQWLRRINRDMEEPPVSEGEG